MSEVTTNARIEHTPDHTVKITIEIGEDSYAHYLHNARKREGIVDVAQWITEAAMPSALQAEEFRDYLYAHRNDATPTPTPTDDDVPDVGEISREVDPDLDEIERIIPPPDTDRISREVDPDLTTLESLAAAVTDVRKALGWIPEHRIYEHIERTPTDNDFRKFREEVLNAA